MKLKFTLLAALSILVGIGSAWSQKLWGTTSAGVADNKGVIFNTNSDGTGYQVKYNFITDFPGSLPQNKLTLANGKLYGTTYSGGANDLGIIFEYDQANNTYTKKFDFSAATGKNPQGGLVLASNGLLYGTTTSGGASDAGILFEYDPVGDSFTKKFDISSIGGANPQGNLIQASNLHLYGMTPSGGASSNGILFEYDPVGNSLTKRIDFAGSSNGASPLGDLAEANNSKLYGMTSTGGTNSEGVLFEYDPGTFALATKLNFSSATSGAYPGGSLVKDPADGKLYGMTSSGGSNGVGVIFSYDPAGSTFTKKIDLVTASGSSPQGSLIKAGNGLFYGMALNGGANNEGVIFEYNATGNTLSKKFDFSSAISGANPLSNLAEAPNGKLYGMTPYGGPAVNGILFEYDPATVMYTKKVDFSNSSEGSNPQGSLTEAPNGMLYGMANGGGSNAQGVLYEYDPVNDIYSKKLDFSGSANGAYATGNVVLAGNGKLYGMTPLGGTNGAGLIFEYDPGASSVTAKFNFTSATSGANPQGSLVLAANGKLYGMTSQGGANSHGVLFEYNPSTSTWVNKYSFPTTANGISPLGSMVLGANGKLYGMTSQGGSFGFGVIFEYNTTTAVYTKRVDFTGTNGSFPYGDLFQATNGKLYGMTSGGGANSVGVIFEYDPVLFTATVKHDFTSATTGASPSGSLAEVAGGLLYGMNSSGGSQNGGVLFKFDLSNFSVTNLLDFGGANGATPIGSLLVVPGKQSQTITFNALAPKMFGDADFSLAATASSGLPITYTSSDPLIASILGSTVHIVTFGTVDITASQGGNASYNFAPNVVQPLVISKASQTITFGTLPAKTFNDPSFDLTATASSGLTVTFVSSDPTTASISGITVTILKAGTVTITASQPGDSFYNAAPDVPRSLLINKADQTIVFAPPPTKTYGDIPFALSAVASSGLTVTFSTPDIIPLVSFSGPTVTILGAGFATITASQPGNANYNAAPPDQKVLTINKANQTITFNSLAAKTFGDPPFALTGSATSGLALNYVSSDATVASISGSTVTILKAGSTSITATQPGDGNYNAAPGVPPQTLVVNKANQTISFNSLSVKDVNDPDFTLSAIASSGLPVSYVSGTPSVATVSGNTVHIVAVGTSIITASQAGDVNYNAAAPIGQSQVVTVKLSQTITFGPLTSKTLGDVPFTLTATASSGLLVSYISSNPGVATVSGSTVTIVGGGTTTITASQAGNATYLAATPVNQNLLVQPANQTISFPITFTPTLGDPALTLTATATSGLAVTFTSLNTSKLTISGNSATFVQAGIATVRASQSGNSSYNPAPVIDQTFCIRPAKPAITVTNPSANTTVLNSSSAQGNQWIFNSNLITGANNQTYTVTNSGSYSVIVSVEGCFSAQSDAKALVVTGDLPPATGRVFLYPNPAKDKIFVDLSEFSAEPVELKILDITGRNVHQQIASGGRIVEVSTMDQATGIYILFIGQGSKTQQLKYVKN